jgi:hypothetical protein
MDRALPGWAIDLIRDGVPGKDLATSGHKALWKGLIRTAASAQARGWDRSEWDALILEPRSKLGYQLRVRDNDRSRTPKAVSDLLGNAWEKAWEWRTEQENAWSPEQVSAHAHEIATATLALIADADAELNDAERAVLQFAALEAQRRGYLRVALPYRKVSAATGLTGYATKEVLARLVQRGLLYLEVRGRAGAEGSGKRRASLYGLPSEQTLSPYMCRGTRPMGEVPQTYGRSAEPASGRAAQTYGRRADEAEERDNVMTPPATLTLTLTREEQAAVLATLQRLRQSEHPVAAPADELQRMRDRRGGRGA